jgi:uroporphyrinogen decarboxylase
MVEAIRLIDKALDGEAPFLQTVFSPLMTLMYMTDNAVFSYMRTHSELVHRTLRTVANATIDYLERSLDAGATGIFFATKAASLDFLLKREFDEFGRRYDSEVLHRAKKAEIVVLHIHGKNIMFDDLLDYQCNVINWHDRRTSPALEEARRRTEKCFLGGINEEALPAATPNQIKEEVKDAIRSVECGLVVGPGCVIPPTTPHENIMAARRAIE